MTSIASRSRVDRAETAALFHALSDETRLAVLEMLRGGERCVCDLQDAVDAAQSRLSFHLRVLKDVGLVTDRKEGRWSYYALNSARLADATTALGDLATPALRASPIKLHALERASRLRGDSAAARRSRAKVVAGSGDDCC